MAQRTLREARRMLEGMVLSPDARKEMERAFKEERDRVVVMVREFQTRDHERLAQSVAGIKDDLRDIAREMRDLRRQEGEGSTEYDEYRRRFTDLNHRRHQVMILAASVQRRVEAFEQDEDDPEAAADRMFTKYPITRPNFGW